MTGAQTRLGELLREQTRPGFAKYGYSGRRGYRAYAESKAHYYTPREHQERCGDGRTAEVKAYKRVDTGDDGISYQAVTRRFPVSVIRSGLAHATLRAEGLRTW